MQSASGTLQRVVAMRLAPGEDVLDGLKRACAEHGVKEGLILGGIGSLNGAAFMNPIPLPDKKAGYGYGEPLRLEGPIELVALSGQICLGADGETLFHVHASLSDQQGHGWGGHLIEGNKVLLTTDILVAEVGGIAMGRRYDEDLEVLIFNPTPKK
ncbi:MAG: DNA-binding protein [Planctomycetaceae bacterium]|nr:DNA-binding protein [Planctomycetaceae bacterium]